VGEFQQLVSERDRKSEATLAPGRRLLVPRGGRPSSPPGRFADRQPGGDDKHAVVGEAADDFLLAKQHGVATWRCRREDDGQG
jgi:hypothetical protein